MGSGRSVRIIFQDLLFCVCVCVCECECTYANVSACTLQQGLHMHATLCVCVCVCVRACDEMPVSIDLFKCPGILCDGAP